MDKWLATIVDAINVLFFGCAILLVAGLVLALGFHLGAALGPWWWAGACLLMFAAIIGWAWLETIRIDDVVREWWAPRRGK